MDVFEGKGLLIGGLRFLAPAEAYPLLAERMALLVDLREDYLVAMKRFLVPDIACIELSLVMNVDLISSPGAMMSTHFAKLEKLATIMPS